jgi:hypothetical protein
MAEIHTFCGEKKFIFPNGESSFTVFLEATSASKWGTSFSKQ